MRKLILLFLLFICLHQVNSQTILTGRVISKSDSIAMPFVAIRLLEAKDSALIAGIVTDTTGSFRLETNFTGACILECRYVGFVCYEQNIKLLNDTKAVLIGTIIMATENIDLKEIVIRSTVTNLEEIGGASVLKFSPNVLRQNHI